MHTLWTQVLHKLLAGQVILLRVTVGNSGSCCCVPVTSFEHQLTPLFVGLCGMNLHRIIQHSIMGDLAADRPTWWRWAYLGLWQSSSQLQMISPTLARWRWAYLGSAMLKPAKSLIKHKRFWQRVFVRCKKIDNNKRRRKQRRRQARSWSQKNN